MRKNNEFLTRNIPLRDKYETEVSYSTNNVVILSHSNKENMNTTKTTQTFPVLDMSCAACATRVEKTLNRQPGVYHAQVNYAAATATV